MTASNSPLENIVNIEKIPGIRKAFGYTPPQSVDANVGSTLLLASQLPGRMTTDADPCVDYSTAESLASDNARSAENAKQVLLWPKWPIEAEKVSPVATQ